MLDVVQAVSKIQGGGISSSVAASVRTSVSKMSNYVRDHYLDSPQRKFTHLNSFLDVKLRFSSHFIGKRMNLLKQYI